MCADCAHYSTIAGLNILIGSNLNVCYQNVKGFYSLITNNTIYVCISRLSEDSRLRRTWFEGTNCNIESDN